MGYKVLKIILLLIYLFCTNTLATDWTKVTVGHNGHTFFIDMKKLIENNGFIYFWQLINYNEEDEYGDLSAKIYIQGDCKTFKFRWLKVSYHKMLMGRDPVKPDKPSKLVAGWQFPKENSTSFSVLEHVCENKGLLL